MYLFVFIFLLLSILGLYTEVYTIQAARVFSKQKAIGEIMRVWAGSAYTLANNNPAWGAGNPAGCRLTVNNGSTNLPAPAPCLPPGPAHMNAADLPNGYVLNPYTWKTIVYQPAGAPRRLIVTFVSPPANLSNPITGPSIGYTIGDIFMQLRNTNPSPITFGSVNAAGVFVSRELDAAGNPVTFTMPTPLGRVPAGSVAIVNTL